MLEIRRRLLAMRQPSHRSRAAGQDTLVFGVLATILALVCLLTLVLSVVFARAESQATTDATALSGLAQQILNAMVDQETGERGYLLTGDQTLLDPFRQGHDTLQQLWPQAETRAASMDGDAPTLLAAVERSATAWQTAIGDPETDVAASGRQQAATAVSTTRGKTLFDQFRQDDAALIAYTQKVRAQETQRRVTLAHTLAGLLIVLSLLGLLALILLQYVHVVTRRYLVWAASSEATSRAKDEFISVASHELRTPVAVIKANVQLMLRRLRRAQIRLEVPPEEAESWSATLDQAKEIDRHTTRMTALIDQLQDVNLIMMDRFQIVRDRVDVVALARRVVDETRYEDTTAPEPRITFECDHGSIDANVDAHRIAQALSSLLHNAVKFSPRSAVIEVRIEVRDRDLECAVRDEGVGIPREDQESLFQLFYRAGNAMQHRIGGIGLGLYVARAIVERHDGRIWMTSEEGRGSTFAFSLPGCVVATGPHLSPGTGPEGESGPLVVQGPWSEPAETHGQAATTG